MGVVSSARGALPFAAMVTVECTDVGVSIISKAAMSRGMSNFVYIVYYNALGALILFPYIIYSRKKRAPLTLPLLCVFFFQGLLGNFSLITALTGLKYGSPTLASAIGNLYPVFTFLIAVIFRMEKLDLRRSSTQAKTLGTIVAVLGAFVVTLYRGPALLMASPPSDFQHQLLLPQLSNWVFGGLLLSVSCLSSSIWNIFQAAIVKEYPEKMTLVFFFSFFVSIQCAVISAIVERNPQAWKLRPDMEMVAIGYNAIFGSVFRIAVHVWCLLNKGPVYVAMFRPLGIVIAAVSGVTFLGDTLHLGSVIGAIIIAFGFYTVMWGQAKEEGKVQDNEACNLNSSTHKTPLLQSSSTEEI